jgi:hypothetical protein
MPASASAVATHHFLETFGSAAQPTFTKAGGMVVDPATGDVYVIDLEAKTLSRFKPDGEPAPFSELAGNVIDGHAGEKDEVPGVEEILATEGGLATEAEVAVAPPGSGATEGDIYVNSPLKGRVDVFAPSGEYLTSITGGSVVFPCGVAVGAAGKVFVGDYEAGAVLTFTPSGGTYTEGASISDGEVPHPCQVAVGAGPDAGSVFAGEYSSGNVLKFNPGGTKEYVVFNGSIQALSVDPGNGHLYVGGHEHLNEFNVSQTSSPSEVSSIPIPSEGFALGVAADWRTGNLYLNQLGNPHTEVYEPGSSSEFELNIHDAGSGSGTVSSSPAGIECGTECAAKFLGGTEVELTATPAEGSQFTGWTTTSGSPGTCTGTTSPCKVTMTEAIELQATFDRLPPAVTAVTPDEGPLAGGQTVTITGTNLDGASQVDFGATAVTSFETDTATEIVLKTPAHATGQVDVTVTTSHGGSATGATDSYTFREAPAVTAISPGEGPSGGGTPVTITGTNLAKATKVQFGGAVVNAPFTEDTETSITLTAPGHSAGSTDVVVTTMGGASAVVPADEFTYVGDPSVFALSPAGGLPAGGNEVQITGRNLAGATQVQFGTTVVTAPFIKDTAETITLTAPAHALGTVDVRVTTLAGISAKFAADHYTYETPLVAIVTETPVLPGPPSVTVTPPPAPPPPAPSNVIRPGSARQHGNAMLLKLAVPGPGVITARAKNLTSATATAKGPVTLSLKLSLTATGRKQLKRRGKLTLKVTFAFTPTGGTRGIATRTIVFKAKRGRK